MKYIEFFFCLAIFLILYSYLLYPAILYSLSRVFSKNKSSDVSPITESNALPSVSVVISAYNEESCIAERIENLLSLDYPHDKIQFFIASDGSSDDTDNIISSFNDPRLCVFCFEENRGKINVLNDLLNRVSSEITVFSDANTMFATDAVLQLVSPFNDVNVGAVCGELNLIDAFSGDNKDNLYWKYEQFLKYHESKIDALLGANGGIYAIRTSLYEPLPDNTIIDDFCIVMNVAKQHYQIVYNKEALATEEIAPTLKEEAGRRIRIGAGNYQSLSRLTWLLNPRYKWRWFSYVSHKVIRWFVPHLMIITLLLNTILLWHTNYLYPALFIGQLTFYSFWMLGELKIFKNVPVVGSVIGLVTFFVSMNISLFRGYIRFLSTNLSATWQRTSR
ncbi:glycosyltransferase family 2 protein [Alteromonas gracilis]|uniref:Glycosyltransferase family 2 protein n=1 Tax=Alteromonas gracilis TaxID=1479524 RepID=A0ABX5CLZ9_9ALTE|nr:glycosyltransferase family 2 protein [Alteromonas gracilis]PRO68462.1 glycosyltransferase family 2 protein [Alteromonas gracilis]